MSDLQKCINNLKKLLNENVSSGDFNKSNFKLKLELFLDFVSNKFISFKKIPQSTLSAEIGKLVAAFTPQDLPANNFPQPNPGRIWVSAFYAHTMLDKSFVSQDDIAYWVGETWPALTVAPEGFNEAWKVIHNYSERQLRKKDDDVALQVRSEK